MRKLLIATTALTLAGSAAFAELSMSGDAKLGIDYDSEEAVKHTFNHEVGIDFAGSGTTDGGLSFGGSAGFDSGDETVNTGSVYISGSFGKLTIGDNDAADLAAGGIADVGMNGIGVDDIAEGLRGKTAAQLRYDQSFGAASIAVSAGNKAEATDDNPYAVGLSFSAGDIRIGVGYDSSEVVSLGAGYSVANISVNGFYSTWDERAGTVIVTAADPDTFGSKDVTAPYTAKANTIGADLSYSLGATALTIAYGKMDVKSASATYAPTTGTGDAKKVTSTTNYTLAGTSISGVGVGITHDLGGGATVSAGFGKVEEISSFELGDAVRDEVNKGPDNSDIFATPVTAVVTSRNKASIGITLKF